jgi:hypothetical protein
MQNNKNARSGLMPAKKKRSGFKSAKKVAG